MFSNPARLQILLLPKKEMWVGAITEVLRMDQVAVSSQLKILLCLNIVKTKCFGRYLQYRLNDKHVKNVLKERLKYALKNN